MTYDDFLLLEPDDESEVRVTWWAEMLTDAWRGIYTRWTYHSDGTVTEEKIHKGPVFLPYRLLST